MVIANCKKGLQKIPRARIQHCYRELNKCADALVRRGALLSQDFVIFHFPPVDVSLLINLDAVRTMYERQCSFVDVFKFMKLSWLPKKIKSDVSGGSKTEPIRLCTSNICKNVVDKFASIILL